MTYSANGFGRNGDGANPFTALMTMWRTMPKFPDLGNGFALPGSGAMAESTASVAERFIAFGEERYQADMEFLVRLARCQTLREVLLLQQEWFDRAAQDYRRAGAEMTESTMTILAKGSCS
jgi:hypothetical protein